jgi:signal transduction histidine kinase/ActR/RegA family two-component response regulator
VAVTRIRLRTVLTLIVLATMLPVGIFASLRLLDSWQRQREIVDRQNIDTARAVSIAIDKEVERTITGLQVLSSLADPVLEARRFAAAAEQARRSQASWSSVTLANGAGEILFSTPSSGNPIWPEILASWMRGMAARPAPGVSNLIDDTEGDHGILVGVPAARRGGERVLLVARIRSDSLSAVLREQRMAPNGVLTLLDRDRRIIARSRNERQVIGRFPTRNFVEASRLGAEGVWHDTLLEGTPAYAAFSRSPLTGWTVGVGLPRQEIDGPLRRSVLLVGGLWAGMLGMGAVAAVLLGRRVVRALRSASAAGMALARGEPVRPPASHLAEIQDLSAGLEAAASILNERLADRERAERERAGAALEVERALRAEQAARRDAEAASRLKDEFLMTVSHELRTPLTAISGWAHMLQTGVIAPDQQQRAIATIHHNAQALRDLVDDLLDVSRIVSGKLRLDVRPIDVAAIVEAALDSIRPAADAKTITLDQRLDADAAVVLGDPRRLQQVVWNLLSNAVKFTPRGGVITTRLEPGDGVVTIVVSDTGKGVPAEFLPFVFDRFRQGTAGTTREHGGLGLGLAIVRHLVELHGGSVHASNNTPEPGSTFRVQLPLMADARRPADGPSGQPARAPAACDRRLDGVRVLVVDDEPQAREVLSLMLEQAGAEVVQAESAMDGLLAVKRSVPAVILSDIEMPHEDGYAFIRQVRTLGETRGVRLVALAVTAHARAEDRIKALESGFQWHIAKPVDPAELVSVIATLLSQAGLRTLHTEG